MKYFVGIILYRRIDRRLNSRRCRLHGIPSKVLLCYLDWSAERSVGGEAGGGVRF